MPESIHTDQQFESDIVKHLCTSLGIEKTRTSPYHAQSDGMVERLNRTLKELMHEIFACVLHMSLVMLQTDLLLLN